MRVHRLLQSDLFLLGAILTLTIVYLSINTATAESVCENGGCNNGRVCEKKFVATGNRDYNLKQLTNAVEEAVRFFNSGVCQHPLVMRQTNRSGNRFVVLFPSGRFPIGPSVVRHSDPAGDPTKTPVTFAIKDFDPGPGNRMQFQGVDKARTTLVFPVEQISISGINASGILWQDIHFTKNRLTVSQGKILSTRRDLTTGEPVVRIRLQKGFPSLAPQEEGGIGNYLRSSGRYLLKFNEIKSSNGTVTGAVYERFRNYNGGYPWRSAKRVPDNTGRTWDVVLKRPSSIDADVLAFFEPHVTVGIKSKHGGQAYRFHGGARIWFNNVRWTRGTRGVFRGVGNVAITNSVAQPDRCIDTYSGHSWDPTVCHEKKVSYLASHSGGPQIGQPVDNPFSSDKDPNSPERNQKVARHGGAYHVVANNRFIALGDDPVGLFNLKGRTEIRDNFIVGGIVRGIYHLDVCGFYKRAALVKNTTCRNCAFPHYRKEAFHKDTRFLPSHRARCGSWFTKMIKHPEEN